KERTFPFSGLIEGHVRRIKSPSLQCDNALRLFQNHVPNLFYKADTNPRFLVEFVVAQKNPPALKREIGVESLRGHMEDDRALKDRNLWGELWHTTRESQQHAAFELHVGPVARQTEQRVRSRDRSLLRHAL